jgi:predicted ATPase
MKLRLASCTVDLVNGEVGGESPDRLTPRELQLLRYLAERPETEVSRDELLHDVFGYSRAAQSRAVDKAMSSLRQKVRDKQGNAQHLHTTTGGYRFAPLPPPSLARHAELDAFVGRSTELVSLSALLQRPGVVTLTGPGGVGKTRLAKQALALCVPRQSVLCELAPAESREDVVRALAQALGSGPSSGDKVEQLGKMLAAWDRPVVLLDDFDRLVPHLELIRTWRRLAPHATWLLTSRRSTHLEGERVLRLEPLDRASSLELLTVRAAERDLDVRGAPSLEPLAARLDDLPLALELAAARLGVLAPAQLLERLDQRLELLRSPVPGALARHASLRGMLDVSWEQLDGATQTALAQLSVFAGAFGLEAAEQVLDRPADGRPVIEVIAALLDHSLLQRQGSDTAVRFRLLESVSVYAAERLDALGPQARLEVEQAHGEFFARLQGELDRIRQDRGVRDRLERDLDNLLAACRRAVARADVEVAQATGQTAVQVLRGMGSLQVARELAEAVLAVPGLPVAGQAVMSQAAGLVHRDLGQDEQASRYHQLAWEAARECGRQDLEMLALLELGMHEYVLQRQEAARPYYESALQMARALGDRVTEGNVLLRLAIIHYELGRDDEGEVLALEALELARSLGNRRAEGQALGALGVNFLDRLRLDEADHMLKQAAELAHATGNRYGEALALQNLGAVARERPDHPVAIGYLERALALLQRGDMRLYLTCTIRLCDSLSYVGQSERAKALLEEALLEARSLESRPYEAAILSVLSRCEARLGLQTSALERLRLCRAMLLEREALQSLCTTMCGWAVVEHELGRRTQAREALAEAEGYLARLSEPSPVTRAVLERARARLEST